MEMAAEIDPAIALLKAGQRLDLDRRVADDVEQLLMAPHIAFERRDIEVADHDRRAFALLGPAGHPLDEIQLLAELWIDVAIRNIAAGRDVDIFEPDAAVEPRANM